MLLSVICSMSSLQTRHGNGVKSQTGLQGRVCIKQASQDGIRKPLLTKCEITSK